MKGNIIVALRFGMQVLIPFSSAENASEICKKLSESYEELKSFAEENNWQGDGKSPCLELTFKIYGVEHGAFLQVADVSGWFVHPDPGASEETELRSKRETP